MGNTVLIVEDSSDLRAEEKGALEDEGFQVLTAGNGKEALELLASDPLPCVILLDMMMPILNGWQFLDAVAQDARLSSVPIIVVSAAVRDETLPPSVRCLHKPFLRADLLSAIRESCH